jgi:DNA-binding protein HU-beta
VASKTVVEWVDDIDGGPAAETVSFALDGVEYEIDLSIEHATQLRTTLTEFIRKARPETPGPRRASIPVEDDEESALMPAPVASAESARHLPAPRSAIKSRISATQLAMDVDGLDEPDQPPTKPARTTRKVAAAKTRKRTEPTHQESAKMESSQEGPAKAVAAKTPAARTTTKTTPTKRRAPEPKPTPAPVAAPAVEAKPARTPAPAAAPARVAAAEAKPAATPKPAAAPTPTPAPEPQRPTVASPFSQPAAAEPSAKKDNPPRPPMITFTSAKP